MKKAKPTILLISLTLMSLTGCVDVNVDLTPDMPNVPFVPFIQNDNQPDEHSLPDGQEPMLGTDQSPA